MNSQACAELCWIRSVKDGIANSQIFGDFLELIDRAALFAAEGADGILQAMIKMVRDQGFLRLANGFFDRMHLLRYVQTGAAGLDHLDDGAQMTFGSLEPLDDLGMGAVEMEMFSHSDILSPWRGYCNIGGETAVSSRAKSAGGLISMQTTISPAGPPRPSLAELRRSTFIMSAVALFLGITTVLPAEYGIDPTGIGDLIGLTEMGKLKAGVSRPWKTGFATDPASQRKMAWIAQQENLAADRAFAIAFKCLEAKTPDLELTIFSPVPYSAEANYGPSVAAGLSADRGEIVTLSLVPRNQQGILILTQGKDGSPAIMRALDAVSGARRFIAVGLMGIELSFPAGDGKEAVSRMLDYCKAG